MNKIDKILWIFICYIQALIINVTVIHMLDGINLLAWIIYNVWSWLFVPIIILKAEELTKDELATEKKQS